MYIQAVKLATHVSQYLMQTSNTHLLMKLTENMSCSWFAESGNQEERARRTRDASMLH